MPKDTLALFDFDGTITTKDTLLEFIKHDRGSIRFFVGFALLLPMMVWMKLGMMPNWRAKEIFLAYFFKGRTRVDFQKSCDDFANHAVPLLLRPGALVELAKHKAEHTRTVIVSASPEYWIKPWADKMGIELLATKLQVRDGVITGKIEGLNCYGDEKVSRVQAYFDLSQYTEIDAYGDSSGDKAMLAIASHPHYKPFRS